MGAQEMDEKVSEKVWNGTTDTGFDFAVEQSAADDYELLEDLQALDQGRAERVPAILNALLGKEQAKRLKEHCRDENGKVALTAMCKELDNIFSSINALKN